MNEALDDVPGQVKRPNTNTLLAENCDMCAEFCHERSEAYIATQGHGRGELKPRELAQGEGAARRVERMQAAVAKEWSTWGKYQAVQVISPKEAAKVPKELQIEARGVWTNKGKNLEDDFEPKCRIVGKGFQEKYDEQLRRGSPNSRPRW